MKRDGRRSKGGRTCRTSWTKRLLSVLLSVIHHERETSFRTSGVFQREEAFLRAQREAERKRQERELLHIQEEQERLQRKKVPEVHLSHLHGSRAA